MKFLDISQGKTHINNELLKFHEYRPSEKCIGPFEIWELKDNQGWVYEYHWKTPTETLNPVGFHTTNDLVVTRPGGIILNINLIYKCATGKDNQRSIPHEDDYFNQSPKNKIIIEDRVIVGDGISFDVWGHWLIDYLPRFAVVRAQMGEDFANLKILLPHYTPEWIYYFLKFACNIKRNNIITYNPGSDIILCKKAIIPSYCYTDEFSFHSFVRDFYKSLLPDRGTIKRKRKVLISRSEYMQSNRQLLHRSDFEEIALRRGYEIIHPEKLSLEEQIQIFSEASAVIGEHGSGMHSTLFSAPGTVVGCLGFWNAVQLHIGYLMGHQNVYVTKNCKWPTPNSGKFELNCTPDDLNDFIEKVDSLILEQNK